jgi:hypothetical protein
LFLLTLNRRAETSGFLGGAALTAAAVRVLGTGLKRDALRRNRRRR